MISRAFDWAENTFRSFVRYVQSSVLSLTIIGLMFLLLTKMEQASGMVVDLAEKDWFAFLFSTFFVFALALSLSHYPIYTYYAARLNDRNAIFKWRTERLFGFLPVNVFETRLPEGNEESESDPKVNNTYPQDLGAHLLRYLTGFLVFVAWNYVLIFGFEINLIFEGINVGLIEWIALIVFLLAHFLLYRFFKKRQFQLKWRLSQAVGEEKQELEIEQRKRNFRLTLSLMSFSVVLFGILGWLTFLIATEGHSAYSKAGLLLILFANLLSLLIYYNFRLLRPDLVEVHEQLNERRWLKWFTYLLKTFAKSSSYIGLLFVFFVISIVYILYCHYATFTHQNIPNGIPILLAYLYFYSYVIAILFKFYFVSSSQFKGDRGDNFNYSRKLKIRRRLSAFFVLLALLYGIDKICGFEVVVHELTQVAEEDKVYQKSIADLKGDIKQMEGDHVFFVAAQGGGLKGNFWTLNVLNHLQERTEGQFLDQTVAMSGASGGSLGLGLYTALFREHQKETDKIWKKIDTISVGNYVSMDLTLTFGWDLLRTVVPLKYLNGNQNRSFYSMVKYQNLITEQTDIELDKIPYRQLWAEAYDSEGYFPSLIMNTGSEKGSRGIFWSHKTDSFNVVFPFSENLADLPGDKTIPFYWAVSTTNRFPFLSPSAKIKGKGHYIDVGAVENSGILGCLDLYSFLSAEKKDSVFANKKVVFVEIVNGKSKYVRYVLRKFVEEHPEYAPSIQYEENETATVVADLNTGLNLDKFPEYLSDKLRSMDYLDENFEFIEIPLPHRLSIEDIESHLKGSIEDCSLRSELISFLQIENNLITDVTEKEKGFCEPWRYYEPMLSRHMCQSNINFGKAVLGLDSKAENSQAHYLLQSQFDRIQECVSD